jgi:hypothetical protein
MDATLGINVKPGNVERAVEAMIEGGVEQAATADFPEEVLPAEIDEADSLGDKPSMLAAVKKKARMRSRGTAKRIRTERKG